MNVESIKDRLLRAGIFVILRRIPKDKLLPLTEALWQGGIRAIEVTYNSPDAPEQLRLLADQFSSDLLVGAGTIMTREEAKEALALGAQFLVSPHVSQEMIEEARQAERISIPGAITPTEIYQAHRHGADFIKLFPAGTLGIEYFKQLRGPFDQIPFMAVGGITANNIAAFREAGAIGFGIGSAIIDPKLIESKQFDQIRERCERLREELGVKR